MCCRDRTPAMPPSYVKKTGQLIHYYYAKLVIAPSAGFAGNYGFITGRYKALESGQIEMSNYNRELWLKETEPQSMCAYCGGPGPLVGDHVIPLAASGPDAMHNILRVCRDCNATKSNRDLIEWWNTVQGPRLGDASVALPRLAAGIYLKLAYDWHRMNNSLETPARDLERLRPFMNSAGRSRGSPGAAGTRPPARTEAKRERPVHVEGNEAAGHGDKRRVGGETDTTGALDLVLERCLYKEDLQELLSDLDLPVTGSKEELITRLKRVSEFDPRDALRFLDREELGRVCEELELPSGGLFRGSLEDRILAAILTERRSTRH